MDEKIMSIIDALELKFDESLKQVAESNELGMYHYNGIAKGFADSITQILEVFPHLREKYPHA